MADMSDVETALVGLIAAALFPDIDYQAGDRQPSAVSWPPFATQATPRPPPAAGTLKVYRGWPVANDLDEDLRSCRAHISVFPEHGMSRNVTRYQQEWEQASAAAPTLTATLAGSVVTFGGTGGAGQVAGIAVGAGSLLMAYPYRLSAGDTPATVAAYFAGKIPGATASGTVLTAPGVAFVDVVADQTAAMEVRRVQRGVRVSCWCPTPAARDALASFVDGVLAANERFPAAGNSVRLIYRADYIDDMPSRDRLWRRDLCYTAEFPTTMSEQQPAMLFGTLGLGIARNPAGLAGGLDILLQAGQASPIEFVWADGDYTLLEDAAGNILGPRPT